MNIQVIGYDDTPIFDNSYSIDYTKFNSPNSLDEYDINIILLQDERIWTSKYSSGTFLDLYYDLCSLKTMLTMCSKTINIIFYPLNYTYKYSYNGKYYQSTYELKDQIPSLIEMISFLNPFPVEILYENVKTVCNGETYKSAFYFKSVYLKSYTVSDRSCKNTTIAVDSNMILSTIDISSYPNGLKDFLITIGMDNKNKSYPEWLNEVVFYNDKEHSNIIVDSENKILELKNKIIESQKQLDSNLKYKSILTTNGDELVEVVFDILEQILNYDLSNFKDEKKEDFVIKLNDVTFIGEIKGISSNIKSEHISQLDVHVQGYNDRLQADNLQENIKPLLIINPFKTKPLLERSEVHETQIALAIRNGSLIIPTEVLLKIYEMYLEGKVNKDKIINILKTKIGLIKEEDLYNE